LFILIDIYMFGNVDFNLKHFIPKNYIFTQGRKYNVLSETYIYVYVLYTSLVLSSRVMVELTPLLRLFLVSDNN